MNRLMNRFWLVIIILLSIILAASNSVQADDILIESEIYSGIDPTRRLKSRGLQRSYSWEFENKPYTALIVIDEQQYNRIRNQKKERRHNDLHFPPMAYKGAEALRKLINEFKDVMPKDWVQEKQVNFVLAFVQAIPWTDDRTTGYDEFYKNATETLAEGKGDCEDTSILFSAILSGLGFKSALLGLPGHLAVGVKGNFRGYFVPYESNSYYYCETTNKGWKLGNMPKRYIGKEVRIMPITPNPVQPKQVTPQSVPSRPSNPARVLPQISLQNGIDLFYEARYNEAIKSLQLALSELTNPEQRAEAYIYLGKAEYTFPGDSFSASKARAKARFQEALRENPEQKIKSQKFRDWFEKVRSESIGELTVSASPPQAEIWISGNGIDEKKLGTGIKPINLRLFKGKYTVEGIYAERSSRQTIDIKPNTHKELEIRIPVDDQPPKIALVDPISTATVNQRIQIKAKVTDDTGVKRVYLFYRFSRSGTQPLGYDRIALTRTASGIYTGYIPSQSEMGYIWYYLTAIDTERNEGETKKRKLEVKPDSPEPLTIEVLYPPEVANVDQRIQIKAKVTGDIGVERVYLFYRFSRSGTQPSEYDRIALTRTTLGIYTGYIPSQSETGYIWYYLTTDREGNNPESEIFKIRIKRDGPVTPPAEPSQPIARQGIWANYAWSSSVFENGTSLFDLNRGDSISLTYLREGKSHRTLGVQLDYSDQNSSNMGLTVQWFPALGGSPVVFTLLGGVVSYSNFDSARFSRQVASGPIHRTPVFGGGLKLYPLDKVSIEAIVSFKRQSDFDTIPLYHYEIGTRIYINESLNLKFGYSQFHLGGGNIKRMQIGLGFTF